MTPEDERKVRALIDTATHPIRQRLDQLEREIRRLKSDNNSIKNTVQRLSQLLRK